MADKNMKAKINVEFEEAASRQQINSGEDISTLFGKIRKFLADLKAVAFSGAYSDLSGTPDLTQYASKAKYGDTTINVGRKAGTTVGDNSTAEGKDTTAMGNYSHSEGMETSASGAASHAEGYSTYAVGYDSHSGGYATTARGNISFAHGYHVISKNDYEIALGKCNVSTDNSTLFSVGNGTDENNRHNAFEITKTGGKLHDKDIATTDLIPTELPANGGNADTVDGKHASDFAKSENPSIEGNIHLLRSGNATTNGMIFAWEDTVRIRNSKDESVENQTYTDLIVTPDGIYTESLTNGVIHGRTKIESGKPYITGSATVAAHSNVCITNHGFMPSAVIWWENSGGREIRSASSFDTTSFNPSVIDTSERVLNYIIFK